MVVNSQFQASLVGRLPRVSFRLAASRAGMAVVALLLALLPASAVAPVGAARTDPLAPATDGAVASRLPFNRIGHTMVFDTSNNRMIVFGGFNGRASFNDVWALSLTSGAEAWTKLDPGGLKPAPRSQHSAIYDVWNHRMIIFGGHSPAYNWDDVWALDVTTPGAETWTPIIPSGPAIQARRWHTAIYDEQNRRMIVFGGGGRGSLFNDVWALSLTPGTEAWSPLAVTGSVPAARGQHSAVYDHVGQTMIVFGGASPGGLLDDTWVLSLTVSALAWTRLTGPGWTAPPARRGHIAINANGNYMLVYGGTGGSGALGDAWLLDLVAGSPTWQLATIDGISPSARAWQAAAVTPNPGLAMVMLGGWGAVPSNGAQWRYSFGSVTWAPITPTLPGGGAAGAAPESVLGDTWPEVTLEIEDALPDTTVNLMRGTEVWYVTRLKSVSSTYRNDVDVTFAVDTNKLLVTQVGTRYKDADDVTNWTTPVSLGNGLYRINDVDLEKRGSDTAYQMQVVFKTTVKTGAAEGIMYASVSAGGTGWPVPLDYSARASIYRDPRAWIIVNRKLLFGKYANDNVRALLDEVFEQAQGTGYNDNPTAVVLYADRYVPALKTWNNAAVSYTSENIANTAANALNAWLDSWPEYPDYLLIVGDDNLIPRYRQYDDTGGEGETSLANDAAIDPVLQALVSHNYFFTDNPYGNTVGGSDWETGDLEIAVGRIVGALVSDMQAMLTNGARGPDTSSGRAIIASSTDWDWQVPGGNNDVLYPFNLMHYAYNAALIDDNPTKTDLTREMARGFAAMTLGGHGSEYGWLTPGGAGPDWPDNEGPEALDSREFSLYDTTGSFSRSRPFVHFGSCRVGLAYSQKGAYGSMIYALARHQASGSIAAGGLSCCTSPQDLLLGAERLNNDVWVVAALDSTRTDPLGWSLMQAKVRYTPDATWDASNKKEVQIYTYFGVPWMRIKGAGISTERAASSPEMENGAWSVSVPDAVQAGYVVTARLDTSIYAISATLDGYNLVQVQGMRQATNIGRPVLPIGYFDLSLPMSATVTSMVFTATQPVTLAAKIPTLVISSTVGALQANLTDTLGTHAVTASLDIRHPAMHQLARIAVIPVSYDAAAQQATLYRDVTVEVRYDTPRTLALTSYELNQTRYLPGQTISATGRIVNAGDATADVTATLVLQDAEGQIAGWQASAMSVLAGEEGQIGIAWTGNLDGGAYRARLYVWQAGHVVAAAAREIFVSGGQIASVDAPPTLMPGQTGTFTITFDNDEVSGTMAIAGLSIYDADGGLAAYFEPRTATAAGGESAEMSFSWTADRMGPFTASAVVMAGGQEYGPVSRSFGAPKLAFVPLVVRP